MLQFFRKYQKYFFFVITVVIIFSFAFFGTSRAFGPTTTVKDEVVYKTAAGKKVGQHYLTQFCQFLKSEGMGGGRDFFSANYLNDGIITREFLDTNVALTLFESDPSSFAEDLQTRLQKEKHYVPYTHPYSRQISADSIWSLFAPDVKEKLALLQSTEDTSSIEGFQARIDLYLAERRFPPQMLANMLRYQERDTANHLPADPKLMRGDVSLFGYHQLEEWFGAQFIEKVAKVIMETAAIARERGYKVSRDEITSEILYKSQKTYEALSERMNLPMQDGSALLQVFMRQAGFEEADLMKIYEEIVLFKRLLHDVGNSVIVDTLPLEDFYAYAGESVTVEVTQLPQPLRFASSDDLKEFEIYLAALAGEQDSLLLPTEFSPAPELVGKRYRLYVGQVKKSSLQAKVSVKETWKWEEQNWERLQEEFAQLRVEGEPLAILEAMEPKKRARIDGFVRHRIAETHPEWIEEALIAAQMEEKEIFLSVGSKAFLSGVDDVEAFKAAIDAQDELVGFTQDEEHFYRILVFERTEDEVLTFAEAKKEGVITTLAKRFDGEKLAEKVVSRIQQAYPVSKEQAVAYRFFKALKEQEDFPKQFAPVKRELTLTRIEPTFISIEQVLAQEEGMSAAEGEGAYSYRVVDHRFDTSMPIDKVVQAQELLSKEVRGRFLKEMINA